MLAIIVEASLPRSRYFVGHVSGALIRDLGELGLRPDGWCGSVIGCPLSIAVAMSDASLNTLVRLAFTRRSTSKKTRFVFHPRLAQQLRTPYPRFVSHHAVPLPMSISVSR